MVAAVQELGAHRPYPLRAVATPIARGIPLWRPYMLRHQQNPPGSTTTAAAGPSLAVSGCWSARLGREPAAWQELVPWPRPTGSTTGSSTNGFTGTAAAPWGCPASPGTPPCSSWPGGRWWRGCGSSMCRAESGGWSVQPAEGRKNSRSSRKASLKAPTSSRAWPRVSSKQKPAGGLGQLQLLRRQAAADSQAVAGGSGQVDHRRQGAEFRLLFAEGLRVVVVAGDGDQHFAKLPGLQDGGSRLGVGEAEDRRFAGVQGHLSALDGGGEFPVGSGVAVRQGDLADVAEQAGQKGLFGIGQPPAAGDEPGADGAACRILPEAPPSPPPCRSCSGSSGRPGRRGSSPSPRRAERWPAPGSSPSPARRNRGNWRS